MTWSDATPLVVFGDDWGRHVSTMQHLFRWIIPRHPVVWVNAIGHRKPRPGWKDLGRAAEKARAMLRGSRENGDAWGAGGPAPRLIVQPRVLPWHDRPLVYAWNVRNIVRAVRDALGALGTREPPVVVTGTPPSAGAIGRLGESAAVYFCMDDFLHLPSVSADMIGPLERQLLDRVDAVVATAHALTLSKVPRTGRAHYLPQGVNYSHFATPREAPPELARLPRPVIGFAGGLYPRCDLALVRRLALDFPQGSLVLVGPVHIDTVPMALPNVHIVGARPYSELPAWVQHFDVGIIPYLLNDETRAVDPLKLLEYLAAGLPVVCSALPEAEKYRSHITIAADHDGFTSGVRAALARGRAATADRGRELAREHTWEKRAEELLGIVGELAAPGRRPLTTAV